MRTVKGTIIEADHDQHAWAVRKHLNITIRIPLSAAQIRKEIASGDLHAVGRTTLDGRKAIALGLALGNTKAPGLHVRSVLLWVNAKNYLPMRAVLKFSNGKQAVTDYSFLRPSAANFAALRPYILPGYHRVYVFPLQRPKH